VSCHVADGAEWLICQHLRGHSIWKMVLVLQAMEAAASGARYFATITTHPPTHQPTHTPTHPPPPHTHTLESPPFCCCASASARFKPPAPQPHSQKTHSSPLRLTTPDAVSLLQPFSGMRAADRHRSCCSFNSEGFVDTRVNSLPSISTDAPFSSPGPHCSPPAGPHPATHPAPPLFPPFVSHGSRGR